MEGSALRKGEEGGEVAMDTSTRARLDGPLELEKLFNERRAGREDPKHSFGKARRGEGRSRAIKVRKPFLFQGESGEREGKKRAGGGEREKRLGSEVSGAKKGRDKRGRSQSEQLGKLREWSSGGRGEQGKEGEGLISHERIDERRNPPIIARRWSEASGERNQYLVFQGCLRRRLPASAGIGQKRSQC